MKVEYKADTEGDYVVLEISQGEHGGIRKERIYILLEMDTGVCDGYIDREKFDKLAQAFAQAKLELDSV